MTAPDDDRLGQLLATAIDATPDMRIEFRDRVAAHGPPAVTAMSAWLKDGTHPGFAIRTLERIAESDDPPLSALAIRAQRRFQLVSSGSDLALTVDALKRLDEPVRPAIVEPDPRLYERLIDAARERRLLPYSEVGAPANLRMDFSYHRRLIGQMLGRVSEREVAHGRPMLSSIVVHKGGTSCGSGFYPLGLELGMVRQGEDPTAFERRQQSETFDFWMSHPDAGPLG